MTQKSNLARWLRRLPGAIVAFTVSYAAFLAFWIVYNMITLEGLRANAMATPGALETFGSRASEIILVIRLLGLLVVPALVLLRASWWGLAALLAVTGFWASYLPNYVQAAMDEGSAYALMWLSACAFLFISSAALLHKNSRRWFRSRGLPSPEIAETFD